MKENDINTEVLEVRDTPTDGLSTALKTTIASTAAWTAPCTFKRTEKAPLDPKSCFDTYAELTAYLAEEFSTAYPGMVITVTNMYDENQGTYVLVSNGTSLTPVKLSTQSTSGADIYWLNGDGTQA